ncbi:UNVERIFIED_CONTAM: hypothetical protein HHA_449990 [Hammondia hammondi]|eukprot:XP_008882664.1 hypothetical protein HHA_449990 [Hammondia hammondi]
MAKSPQGTGKAWSGAEAAASADVCRNSDFVQSYAKSGSKPEECQWAFFPTFEVSELWTFPTNSRSLTSSASPRDLCPRAGDSRLAAADGSLPDDVSSELSGGGSSDDSDNADGQLGASRLCGRSRSGEQERQPPCGNALRVRGTGRKEGRERQKPRIPELVLPAVPCGEPYTTIVLVPMCLGYEKLGGFRGVQRRVTRKPESENQPLEREEERSHPRGKNLATVGRRSWRGMLAKKPFFFVHRNSWLTDPL